MPKTEEQKYDNYPKRLLVLQASYHKKEIGKADCQPYRFVILLYEAKIMLLLFLLQQLLLQEHLPVSWKG